MTYGGLNILAMTCNLRHFLILSVVSLVCDCTSFQYHDFKHRYVFDTQLSLSATPDQLRVLTMRGEIEEQLMTQKQSPLVHKPGQYFETLRRDGVVRIDNVVTQNTARDLRDYVVDLERRSLESVMSGEVPFVERFANVLVNTKRCDLKIPLGPAPVLKAMEEILHSPVRHTIEKLLGTDCTLYELSCLISHPGSQRQNVHPDHPCIVENDYRDDTTEPLLLTCFVSLQDIEPDMGPTVWIPGTHNARAHDRFQRIRVEDVLDSESPKDQLLRSTPSVVGLLPLGSCAVFDSRLLHCGTANTSPADLKKSRVLFYLSFKHPKIGYPGNEGSIGYGLKDASLPLRDLSQCILNNGIQTRQLYQNP